MMPAVLLVCGGFLLAVLWFDLMFDVQGLGAQPMSAEALVSVVAYYRRVTTDAAPMGYLVGAVMLTTLVGSGFDVVRDAARRRTRVLAFLLAAAPIVLAALRVFPHAVALGGGGSEREAQQALAVGILRDHLFCFAAMLGFVIVELRLAASTARVTRAGRE
jgi:hypothetical protein